MKKNPFPPNLREKKARRLECMLGPSHWLHEISHPKRVCQDFWPGLIIPLCKEHPTHSMVLAELCRLSFTSQVLSKSDVKTRAKTGGIFLVYFGGREARLCRLSFTSGTLIVKTQTENCYNFCM